MPSELCKPYLNEDVVGDKPNIGSLLAMLVFIGVLGMWLFSAKGMVGGLFKWMGIIKPAARQVSTTVYPTVTPVNIGVSSMSTVIPTGTVYPTVAITVTEFVVSPTVIYTATLTPTLIKLTETQTPTMINTGTIAPTFYIPLPTNTEVYHAPILQPTREVPTARMPTYTPRPTYTLYPTSTRYPTYTPFPTIPGDISATPTNTATASPTATARIRLPYFMAHWLPIIFNTYAGDVRRPPDVLQVMPYPIP